MQNDKCKVSYVRKNICVNLQNLCHLRSKTRHSQRFFPSQNRQADFEVYG